MNRDLIDRALLERATTFDDGDVVERMFHLPIGQDRCWANLYRPRGDMAGTGFVVVHAFGLELLWLHRIERGIARALASSGYPVLAVNRRGFGDSTGEIADASIAQQTEDIEAACDSLALETGVDDIGLIAGRFGSVIAAEVLRSRPVSRLMLMNPVLDGVAYFRSMFRDMNVISLAMGLTDRPEGVDGAIDQMRRDGVVDVLGQPVFASVYDDAASLDTRAVLGAYPGNLLLCQISKRATESKDALALRDGVEAAGGQVTVEIVREPTGASFGHSSQVRSPSGAQLREALGPVEEALAAAAVRWMGR